MSMIGIVILNYKNWSDTYECIKSIFETTKENYHIYLVDNASPNKMDVEIEELIKDNRVTLIINKKNCGYAAGNNVGISMALQDKCDYILIANNDVRFYAESISNLKIYLERHKEVGIVGPKIVNIDEKVMKTNICMRTGLKEKYLIRTRAKVFFRKRYKKYFGLDRDYEHDFSVYALVGCCFMMTRRCAIDITPLDENTFLYEEEFIIGIRMAEKGYITMYHPDSVIQHLHGKSTESVKPFAFMCMICSEIYYCYMYLEAKKWQIRPLYWYRTVLYLLRCIKSKEFRQGYPKYREVTKHALAGRNILCEGNVQ